MKKLSQAELDKLLSPEIKSNPKAASRAAKSDSRFQRFAGLYSKNIADSGCNLTQDELDQVFTGPPVPPGTGTL
ncbi:MAG: hypothetical protein LBT87_10015 [Treponema sp.]|jgi:hypothetical protein|nr:hypothetical protein [Treponema sp.]